MLVGGTVVIHITIVLIATVDDAVCCVVAVDVAVADGVDSIWWILTHYIIIIIIIIDAVACIVVFNVIVAIYGIVFFVAIKHIVIEVIINVTLLIVELIIVKLIINCWYGHWCCIIFNWITIIEWCFLF